MSMASATATTVCAKTALLVCSVRFPNRSARTASLLMAHAIALKDSLESTVVLQLRCALTGVITTENATTGFVSVTRDGVALIAVIAIALLAAALQMDIASTVHASVAQDLEERIVDL